MTASADLHCHPDGKNFYKYSVADEATFNQEEAHLWNLPKNNFKHYFKGFRGTHYSQSDIGRCLKGGTRLIFVAIYPFEQGFCKGKMKKNGQLVKIPNFLLKTALGYTKERIKYVKNDAQYEYYKELNREYEFLLRKSGQAGEGIITYHKVGDKEQYKSRWFLLNYFKIKKGEKVKGTYWIISQNPSKKDDPVFGPRELKPVSYIDHILQSEDEVGLILTIEGMHSISMKNLQTPVSKAELWSRIKTIKEWPILFITFAHHFDNNLCAHAKSFFLLPKLLGRFNPHQSKNRNFIDGTNHGFNTLGYETLEKLLSIKIERKESGVTKVEDDWQQGRRILIDVKHMSVAARKDLYAVIEKYNQDKADDKKIPIIASHVAYSGIKTIHELINRSDRGIKSENKENDLDNDPSGRFNPWNINLSDEDIQIIYESRGLIGLNLDQRVLGVMHKNYIWNLLGAEHRKSKKADFLGLIIRNLLSMADAMKEKGLHRFEENTPNIWYHLAMGSDFDGGIDPVNTYKTVSQYPNLRADLKKEFRGEGRNWNLADYNIRPENADRILDLIFFENAKRLVVKHLKNAPVMT